MEERITLAGAGEEMDTADAGSTFTFGAEGWEAVDYVDPMDDWMLQSDGSLRVTGRSDPDLAARRTRAGLTIQESSLPDPRRRVLTRRARRSDPRPAARRRRVGSRPRRQGLTVDGRRSRQPSLRGDHGMGSFLVTGAASGIGLATARALAREGHRVFALDRDGDRLATRV